MDSPAMALCQENDIPIIVFSLDQSGNIKRAITGEKIGTVIS